MRYKSIGMALLLTISVNVIRAQSKYNMLIGTNTVSGKSEGIYVYEFDAKTGALTYKNKATGIKSPGYLAISADNKYVYSVSSENDGMIYAYKYEAASGKLTYLNKRPSGGVNPCYVSTDATGKLVFAANYTGGSLAAIPVNADGSLSDKIQVIQHEGGSIDLKRQDRPHVHSVILSPDNKFLFAQDLGTDKIYIYKINFGSNTPLTPAKQATVGVTPGSGPRHLAFSPNGKFAYVIGEMSGLVHAYEYNSGKLKWLQDTRIVGVDFTGEMGGADIHVSPDGKFLYTSNRGTANNIVIHVIDPKKGTLKLVARHTTMGQHPRNFTIDPTGNFLLVANQYTDDVFVFVRDAITGLITPNGTRLPIGAPMFLGFTPAN